MKEPYEWNYKIKIKTKDGTFEYEKEHILEAVMLIQDHPDYEEFYAEQSKPKKLAKTRELKK